MKYKKITLIFPGQGSQFVGMGKDFYDQYDFVREIYDQANEILGYDIAQKCFRPHLGKKIIHRLDLDKTVYTQPAVMITSYACFKVFQKRCEELDIDLDFTFAAGHSLGEYTALLASGAIDFETCLDLVKKRATFITEFSKSYPDAGLMAIVDKKNGLDGDRLQTWCQEFQVYLTLVNTKKQVVVGGFKKNLAELSKKLKREGTLATVLRVEGPFHSPLMKPAADRFKQELDKTDFSIASRPVIANVTTEAIVDPDHIKVELYRQIFTSVNWRRSIEKIVRNGGDLFIEVGPKKVLSNMLEDIYSSVSRLNVQDPRSLEDTLKELADQSPDHHEEEG